MNRIEEAMERLSKNECEDPEYCLGCKNPSCGNKDVVYLLGILRRSLPFLEHSVSLCAKLEVRNLSSCEECNVTFKCPRYELLKEIECLKTM